MTAPSDLYSMLKQIVADQLGSYGLTDYRIGTVVQASPLRLQLDDQDFVGESFLLLTEAVKYKALDLKHSHQAGEIRTDEQLMEPVIVNPGLAVGDKVLLLKVARGQKFIILSKVVQP